jgi:hypothetical protein
MSLLAWIILIFVVCWIFQDRSIVSTQPAPPNSPVEMKAKATTAKQKATKSSPFPELEKQIRKLAKIAWSTEAAFYDRNFFLAVQVMADASHDRAVERFLGHARRIAPGLAVPYKVPRIAVEQIADAAGYFQVDDEGWVTISVSPKFAGEHQTACSILAHEVCHYILGNSGIWQANVQLNERYTDLCMFVLGFGEVFLAGYRPEEFQQVWMQQGHLGYLTEAEYAFAQDYVKYLRQSCEVAPPAELVVVQNRLVQLTHDREVADRIMAVSRQKFPQKTELELYQYEVDRLEWERRRG